VSGLGRSGKATDLNIRLENCMLDNKAETTNSEYELIIAFTK
jgi:hypothetical protein